jgi:predicted small secreted protein
MKRKILILVIAILCLAAMLLTACTKTSSTTGQQPIEVVSVQGPIPPLNPGGPVVEITLKNVSGEPVVSLQASLGITRAGPSGAPFAFNFNVTTSNPLLPDTTISNTLTLIGGEFSDNVSYPLTIEGKLKSGPEFLYTRQVQIESPDVQNPDPWPGVPVYNDSNSPIISRVNETFSIVLAPAPLFGWGWQNQDLSAFTLLETKEVPGPGNEPNTFGPNAFLFKALETGTFQITLYVPSKPPQQTESFNVVVNP